MAGDYTNWVEVTEERNTVEVQSDQIIVQLPPEEAVAVIDVGTLGPPGQTGQTGIQGPRGIPGVPGEVVVGTGDATYVHRQEVAATVWTIPHNLGKIPSVTVVDSGDTEVFGEVNYPSLNTVILTFNSEFTGKVYLN